MAREAVREFKFEQERDGKPDDERILAKSSKTFDEFSMGRFGFNFEFEYLQ